MKKLDTCLTPSCKTGLCRAITSGRDSNYYLGAENESFNETCMVTGWEVSHFFFHGFIGFFLNIESHLIASVGYEVYERAKYDCASFNDLVINFMGFLVGSGIKHLTE